MTNSAATATSNVIRKAGKSTAILQVFSGFLLVVLVVLFVDMWQRQQRLIDGIRENALWSAYQLDREAHQLQTVLSIALNHQSISRREAKKLLTRYDILFSRIQELRVSDFQDYFTEDKTVAVRLKVIHRDVLSLITTFDAIAAGQTPKLEEISEILPVVQEITKKTGEFVVYTNNATSVAQADNRSQVLKLQGISAVMTGLLVLSVIFLIITLRRQLKALREAGLGLETMTGELTSAYEAADAGNRAKSQFMATMGHEIRTPLNAILGMAELMQMSDLPQEERDNVRIIRSSGEALLEILNEILDFAKIEHGSLELEIRPIDLRTLAESTVAIIRGRAEEKGFDILLDMPQVLEMPVVSTDPTRLRQVILNLLSNAVKFTDHGGVTFRLRERTVGDDLHLVVEVEDSGIGIDEEGIAKLFKPFSQVDASISRKYGGTGLGLTICKQIIEQLGGEIGVTSVQGKGSVFHFDIPVGRVANQKLASEPSAEAKLSELPRRRILLVEDNRVNQQVATRFLNRLGQDVTIAENGLEAVEITAREQFDLILMDMQMPVMDGIEATRKIIARGGRAAQTPIIAMTANASDDDRRLCMSAGMVGFEPKPISMPRLHALLSADAVEHETPASQFTVEAARPMASEECVVDEDRRAELVDALGEDIYQELVESFFNDSVGLLDELRQALAANDAELADRALHTLKGAASNIGLACIASRASALRSDAVAETTIEHMHTAIEAAKLKLAA